jgi:hypothetical protein
MFLLLSGEGLSDIGACHPVADVCNTDTFKPGPMAWMVDKLIESFLGYEFSHIETERVRYVSKSYLAENKQQPARKRMALRGKKRPAETKYYYENARVLACLANQLSLEIEDKVIAVLFRDADGPASAGRGNWSDKRNSMLKGFAVENLELGVPMVPNPKSEAWILCAVKDNPYQACGNIENESGNDNSPNPLKQQLQGALDGKNSTEELNGMMHSGAIDVLQIDMNSYNHFKDDLLAVVRTVSGKVGHDS